MKRFSKLSTYSSSSDLEDDEYDLIFENLFRFEELFKKQSKN